jgi:optic atrophy 3 protein
VTKIAGLLVKTLAKPVSKRIKTEFSKYEVTQRLLVRIGQLYHGFTSRMEIWSAGYKIRTINPIAEEKALKDGAEVVGESFVLGVSVTLVVFEYNRSAKKEAEKIERQQAEAAAERKELQRKLRALDLRLHALERTVEKNSRSMFAVLHGGTPYKPPPKGKLVQIVDDDIDFSDDDDDEDDDNGAKHKSSSNNSAKKDVASTPTTTTSATRSLPASTTVVIKNDPQAVQQQHGQPQQQQQQQQQVSVENKSWWRLW